MENKQDPESKPSVANANSHRKDLGAEVSTGSDVIEGKPSGTKRKIRVTEVDKKSKSKAPSSAQEEIPPLPAEAPPIENADDGWAPVWDENVRTFYFHNRFTQASQWNNPRVPAAQPGPPGVGNYERIQESAPGTEVTPQRPHGGYDPTIHGDYDPNADYAREPEISEQDLAQPTDPDAVYSATGIFNRFTGKWQPATLTPENFNDENKSKRQMSAFFDVDAAANSHNGKSLKAERSGKKLTKQELKAFKEKRKEKKEEKRRAWLRD